MAVHIRAAGLMLLCVACVWMGFGSTVTTQEQVRATDQVVVQRFLSRTDEPLTRYRALRRLEARCDRFNKHGWLEAWTALGPEGFKYEIVREGGSEYIRNKVLLPVLENEARLFATGAASRSALTSENYELLDGEPVEPGVVKLLARPKRREVALVDGALFVTEEEADLLRVEGRLAKSPSFWIKRVDVVRRYGRVGGMRVPVRLDSVAQMRLAGLSTLSMTYEYEMINGVSVAPANAVASRP